MGIHREGKATLILTTIVTVSACCATWFFLKDSDLSWLFYFVLGDSIFLMGIMLNFFRNPTIEVNKDDNAILCPCDGKVVVIEEVDEPEFFKEKVLQVSIFMSPLNVHVNRNPISGTVAFQKYYPGKYLMAFNPKSSTDNERNYVVIKNDNITVGFKQIAGFLARRLCWYVKEGDAAEQGGEMGFIKFGSRIDVYMPLSCKVQVKLGDVVKGARTVVATLS